MRAKFTLFGMLLFIVSAGTVIAQGKKQPPTKFTSVYTSLGVGCEVLRGSNGSDDAYLCKGVGGYRVRVYSSAAATHINAELKDDTFPIATVSVGFNESRSRLEWRLANGKPFAVIMRIPRYGPVDDDNPYFGEAVGQELTVRGLKGFENIHGSVGATTPGANQKAREIADKGFIAGKP